MADAQAGLDDAHLPEQQNQAPAVRQPPDLLLIDTQPFAGGDQFVCRLAVRHLATPVPAVLVEQVDVLPVGVIPLDACSLAGDKPDPEVFKVGLVFPQLLLVARQGLPDGGGLNLPDFVLLGFDLEEGGLFLLASFLIPFGLRRPFGRGLVTRVPGVNSRICGFLLLAHNELLGSVVSSRFRVCFLPTSAFDAHNICQVITNVNAVTYSDFNRVC